MTKLKKQVKPNKPAAPRQNSGKLSQKLGYYRQVTFVLTVLLFSSLMVTLVSMRSEQAPAKKTLTPRLQNIGADIFAATGSSVDYNTNAESKIEFKELGIAMTLPPELASQSLVGVPGVDPTKPSKSIAFTTKLLAQNNPACDGRDGWIGVMTRYEGSSIASGHDHGHGSTMFDFPGFHINYQTVLSSCVSRTPGYSADQLTKETAAARKLWDSMLQAKAINDTGSGIIDLTTQSEVAIDIKDYAYSKQNITIKKGTTVTWTNQDTMKHNVMKNHDSDNHPHNPPTKDEVKPGVLAGPLLAKGESYSFTFNEAGQNPYHCSPHPYMNGTVSVVE